MTITGGYSSTKTVTNLSPGTTQQITFDSWSAILGDYTINVCTQLENDENSFNDCKFKDVNVYPGAWTNGTAFWTGTYVGSGVGSVSSTENNTGYLFSIGGNTTSVLNKECLKYNLNTDSWIIIASLPQGRRVLATTVVNDFIYAIGGRDMQSVNQSTVFKYDIAGNTWMTAAPLPVALGWAKQLLTKTKFI